MVYCKKNIGNTVLQETTGKMLSFNISTSYRCHTEHLHKHKKKFQMLIDKHKVPYLNPDDSIRTFDISAPTFTGTLNQQKPVIREEINVVKNTVVNLTDEALTEDETQLLFFNFFYFFYFFIF